MIYRNALNHIDYIETLNFGID